jgi:Phasin protein
MAAETRTVVLHCTLQSSGRPVASANNQPASNRRTTMAQTADSATDEPLDVTRDTTVKIIPAKQVLAVAPGIEKATANVANVASEFLAIFRRNMEAFSKVQQIVMNGNKDVIEKKVDVFQSNIEHAMKSTRDILLERDLKVKTQKIFDFARSNMQDSTGNNNIVSEINARFSADAAQIIQNRV